MAAPNFKLDNLTAILDYNHLQNDYSVDDIMPIHPAVDKWRAFGWHVLDIDKERGSGSNRALFDVRLAGPVLGFVYEF